MKSILITSVGGIGIGNQILNSLRLSKEQLYIVGTDISDNVEVDQLDVFYRVPKPNGDYLDIIERILDKHHIDLAFIGSLAEALWFYEHSDIFISRGIVVVIGDKNIFNLCADKNNLFLYLKRNGITVPKFKKINALEDCDDIDFFPLVLKQNKNASASNHVYVVFDKKDLKLLSEYLLRNRIDIIAQEWVGDRNNEFSISVTSNSKKEPIGVVALRRNFNSAISYKNKFCFNGKEYYISSGISQGTIEIIPELYDQAKAIACAMNSTGPLNLQGKWEKGVFYLIDAHPAITSSVYIKALAGYNEPLYYVKKAQKQEANCALAPKETKIMKKTISIIKEVS